MQIYFGTNEYILAPNNSIINFVNNTSEIHILATNVTFAELETVLLNLANISNIKIVENDTINYINDYNKLISLSKIYDNDLNEEIFSIILGKRNINDQVNKNTADIEFLAIMSDIDL